jgi:ParB family chromosome partitioning protein
MADSNQTNTQKSPSGTKSPKASSRSTGNDAAGSKPAGKVKKRRLGRGIGSLLSVPVDVNSGAPVQAANPEQGTPSPKTGGRLGAMAEAVRGLTGGGDSPQQQQPAAAAQPQNRDSQGSSETEGDTTSPADGPVETLVRLLPIDAIVPNRNQPRTGFDEEALKELAGSIDRSGLMQPVVVRSPGNSGEQGWELVAGERRLRALKLLGRTGVPAIVIEADDQEAAEMALIENLQREDLNPLDRAAALANLRDGFGMSQTVLAERVGLDRSSVANLLRILELDEFCAAAVRRGTLSLGHAKALLAISDDVLRRTTAAAALNAGWSVRELERRVRHLQGPPSERQAVRGAGPISTKQANVVDLERRLGEILGMRVHITLGRKKGSGKLQVEFNSLEQFDTLTDRLGLGTPD